MNKNARKNTPSINAGSLANLLTTADTILTPVMVTDPAYNHLFHNASFTQQTGYTINEVYDIDSWYNTVFPDPKYRSEIRRLWFEKLIQYRNGKIDCVHIVVNVLCRDQTYHWFDIHEHIFGELRVVTFLKVDALQERTNMLLDVIHFKQTLLASLSHDIRGPLASLQTFLKYGDKVKLSDLQWNELLSRIDSQISLILHLVDATVIHQTAELKHFSFNVTQLQLYATVQKILGYFHYDSRQKELDVQLGFAEDTVIHYDLFILEVVLRNIVSNAVKYAPEKGYVRFSLQEDEDFWNIHITNPGPGLTPEQVDNLMQHKTARMNREEIRHGFGLGLLIAKDSFEKYFGKLLVESDLGKRTTFIVRIPKYIPSFT